MRYGPLPKRHRPGTEWRTLAHRGVPSIRGNDMHGPAIADDSDNYPDGSIFDELVIDGWFHLEQMTDRDWWMSIRREDGTDLVVNVRVGERGRARSVLVEEDGP